AADLVYVFSEIAEPVGDVSLTPVAEELFKAVEAGVYGFEVGGEAGSKFLTRGGSFQNPLLSCARTPGAARRFRHWSARERKCASSWSASCCDISCGAMRLSGLGQVHYPGLLGGMRAQTTLDDSKKGLANSQGFVHAARGFLPGNGGAQAS